MNAKNKVMSACKEADTDFSYGRQIIQSTFRKALETEIRDKCSTTSLKRSLMISVNELASKKTERVNKLGLLSETSSSVECQGELCRRGKGGKPKLDTHRGHWKTGLLPEIKIIKFEQSSLRNKVEEQASKDSTPIQLRFERGCFNCRKDNKGNSCIISVARLAILPVSASKEGRETNRGQLRGTGDGRKLRPTVPLNVRSAKNPKTMKS